MPILWKNINVEIDFAYRTFKWHNEAKGVAGVSCVIIGFHAKESNGRVGRAEHAESASPSQTSTRSTCSTRLKTIYNPDGTPIPATHISGYLIDGPDTYMESRSTSLDPLPEIGIGNKPIDGGNYFFTPQERADFLAREPAAEEFFRL